MKNDLKFSNTVLAKTAQWGCSHGREKKARGLKD